jgi:hypothetical protein
MTITDLSRSAIPQAKVGRKWRNFGCVLRNLVP